MGETAAERLKKARELRGYETAKHFSDTHGIPQSTYSTAEAGSRNLSRNKAMQYAGLLRVSLHWLLTGEGEMEVAVSDLSEPAISDEAKSVIADLELLAQEAPEDREDILDLLRKRAKRARERRQRES